MWKLAPPFLTNQPIGDCRSPSIHDVSHNQCEASLPHWGNANFSDLRSNHNADGIQITRTCIEAYAWCLKKLIYYFKRSIIEVLKCMQAYRETHGDKTHARIHELNYGASVHYTYDIVAPTSLRFLSTKYLPKGHVGKESGGITDETLPVCIISTCTQDYIRWHTGVLPRQSFFYWDIWLCDTLVKLIISHVQAQLTWWLI